MSNLNRQPKRLSQKFTANAMALLMIAAGSNFSAANTSETVAPKAKSLVNLVKRNPLKTAALAALVAVPTLLWYSSYSKTQKIKDKLSELEAKVAEAKKAGNSSAAKAKIGEVLAILNEMACDDDMVEFVNFALNSYHLTLDDIISRVNKCIENPHKIILVENFIRVLHRVLESSDDTTKISLDIPKPETAKKAVPPAAKPVVTEKPKTEVPPVVTPVVVQPPVAQPSAPLYPALDSVEVEAPGVKPVAAKITIDAVRTELEEIKRVSAEGHEIKDAQSKAEERARTLERLKTLIGKIDENSSNLIDSEKNEKAKKDKKFDAIFARITQAESENIKFRDITNYIENLEKLLV